MDLRIEKTKCAIRNAFLQLRSQKPLEKITVKELSSLANINKATFYLHYHDIYDLSETLERDIVHKCLDGIEHPENIFSDTQSFVKELTGSFVANEQLIRILFEGNRSSSFMDLFEEELYKIIYTAYPNYQPALENRMVMTFLIYGSYYTYEKHHENGINSVFNILEKFSEAITRMHKDL
ncbi:MAG: TetR/AcrR family transcriptional regulator [Ruminococcus flavefaciens]|nr:TetR/AcrR family transcriptional regulator [Ruminococcus flavefaciens]MCM1229492.1 TetR/AcrR family transcriptional regulator [Ruminococcus flavefaciens]